MFNHNLTTLNPVNKKGRWYHFLLESNGDALHQTVHDLDTTLSGTTLVFPENFVACDVVYTDYDIVNSKTLPSFVPKVGSTGKVTFGAFTPANFTYAEFYVFGYFK